MSTSQSRWMTSNKPSVVYIPLFQRLIRNDMNLGSMNSVQCDAIKICGRLMMVSMLTLPWAQRGPSKLSNQAKTTAHVSSVAGAISRP